MIFFYPCMTNIEQHDEMEERFQLLTKKKYTFDKKYE